MRNFIVSYDLNGPHPTHAEMDEHLDKVQCNYGRILETVWFIKANTTADALAAYIKQILSKNDRLVVVQGGAAIFDNLLIEDQAVVNAWNNQRAA